MWCLIFFFSCCEVLQSIARAPHPITYERKGREFTTEQSLGGNAAELVGWAYRGTHETSNQWIGFT
jgi:hypothetical protein